VISEGYSSIIMYKIYLILDLREQGEEDQLRCTVKTGRLKDLYDVYAAGILAFSVQQHSGFVERCSSSKLMCCCIEQNYLKT